jgi:hypothetical protein
MVRIYPLIRSVFSYILPQRYIKRPGSGGSFSPEYCYSVWLRHLKKIHQNGLINSADELKKVAEIGPGDSLGVGISALLTGSEKYFGFDEIEHTNSHTNILMTKTLAQLFSNKMEIFNQGHSFRATKPILEDYTFPGEIIGEQDFDAVVENIIEEFTNWGSGEMIHYKAPWMEIEHNNIELVDLILSQAVMEHVSELEYIYKIMYKWLKPGGIISHQIDFKAHETSTNWDGHFFMPNYLWNILAHGRKYPINRMPLSEHIRHIQNAGFEIVAVEPYEQKGNYAGKIPTVENMTFSEQDLKTASAYVLAQKPFN